MVRRIIETIKKRILLKVEVISLKLRGIPHGNDWGRGFKNNYFYDQKDIEREVGNQSKRVDNLVLSASEKEVMANDARTDGKGNISDTLRDRLISIDEKIELRSVNAEDFGINELYEDNSELIQDAIDYATGKNLLLLFPPKKIFYIKKTIILRDNCKIDFNYSTIKRAKGDVFSLIRNESPLDGNIGIDVRNLVIDGNKDVDSLDPTVIGHRFSGLFLKTVYNSKLENITVMNTVNGEEQGNEIAKNPAAGVFFDYCKNIDCYNLNGISNDRTAIFINRSKVKIYGSVTNNNKGSGISSANSDECEYYDLVSFHNGYSNISINGKQCKAGNITTYGSKYSGLNIGHAQYSSHGTQVYNVHSYDNTLDGVTVGESNNVLLTNIETYNNSRNNVRIFEESNSCKLVSIIARNSAGGSGIRIDNGINHTLTAVEAYENFVHGIFVGENANVTINSDVKAYNNGRGQSANSAGLCLYKSFNCKVLGGEFYDLQNLKTQESGIWVAGGIATMLMLNKTKGNKTYDIRRTDGADVKMFFNEMTNNDVWVDIVLQNAWISHSSAMSKRNDLGIVTIRGIVKNGATGNDTVVTTLANDYRPVDNILTMIPCFDSQLKFINMCQCTIAKSGSLTIRYAPAGTVYISLDNITYSAR